MVHASTMQPAQLGIARLVRHMAMATAGAHVDYAHNHAIARCTYGDTARRAIALARALSTRGIGPGDVVGTLASATREHLECYFGVPAMGGILHTLNIRMHDADIAAMIRSVGDVAIVVSDDFAERFARIAPLLAGSAIRLVVLAGGDDLPPAVAAANWSWETVAYDAFLREAGDIEQGAILDLQDPPEDSAAAICHTGGTTGLPKAVAYSHRSLWLQAMSLCSANSLGLSRRDTVLPAVPLYHVNGWGLPFAAAMAGASIVLAGNAFKPEHLDTLIENHGVTIAAGVPTIWTDLLAHRAARGIGAFRTLRRVATGGAVVPQRLIADLTAAGVDVIQAWGMTETSSMSVIGAIEPSSPRSCDGVAPLGQVVCGLELRVAGSAGVLPSDGQSVGEIQIRGPWVTAHYLGQASSDAFDGEWLRTGDIGTVDRDGRLRLTDRLKDAVKSGGEWIPSQSLEDALRALPAIADAAIVGLPDDRWQERPLAAVVLAPEAQLDPPAICAALRKHVPGWWVPDAWAVVDALPRTTLGKPDKARLRGMLADGSLAIIDNRRADAPADLKGRQDGGR